MVKPEAVIEHEAKETLLRALSRIAVAADAAAVFASDVAGQRESRLAEKILRPVQILDLDTVIAVVPETAVDSQRLFTQGILIPEDRKPSIRPPRSCNPNPGRPLNRPYDCHPLVNQGSIFRCSVGKICTRTPLKNHGVFEET